MDPLQPHPVMPAIPVDYAEPSTPRDRGASPNTAAALLILGGLGLVFLGGCFCIGVMATLGEPYHGTPTIVFQSVLYVIVLACLSGAVLLFYIAVRGLLRVMHDKH
ncbi:MAG: hypothetical protein ABSH20_13665 [Tepidisphaeraceae bacterium]